MELGKIEKVFFLLEHLKDCISDIISIAGEVERYSRLTHSIYPQIVVVYLGLISKDGTRPISREVR